MIAGDNPTGKENHPENITTMGFVQPATLATLVGQSEMVICRSGYSTIMDLVSLKRSALLVPTPGQTEQLYLAGYLAGKGYFAMAEQSKLSISDIEGFVEPGRFPAKPVRKRNEYV
ncbi:MAG: glycosyltransferase [Bacteroidales bacterium]